MAVVPYLAGGLLRGMTEVAAVVAERAVCKLV